MLLATGRHRPRAMNEQVRIGRARPEDLHDVLALLDDARLPLDGLRDHFEAAFVARRGGAIVGCIALEIYPDGALLRSAAVAPAVRRQHVGAGLTAAALDLAAARGVSAVYLLTSTAEQYFPRFGFERIERAEVPPGVQTSVEFTSACPSSAAVMRKILPKSATRGV
jgi:amino-acid N-acetyltransferase